MRKLIFSILFVVICVSCFGQKLRFITLNCAITKEEKDTIAKVVNYELAFYRKIFTIKKIPTVNIKLYGDHDKFKEYQKKSPKWDQSETGFYSDSRKEVCVYKGDDFKSTCYHEINHFIFHTQLNIIPTWVNEGLSDYFGNATIDTNGNVQIKSWWYGKNRMKKLIAKNKFNLEWLVSSSPKRFYKRHEIDHYVEAWSVIYFLMEKNQKTLTDIIIDLKAKYNSVDAINKEYAGGIIQLQKDVISYYQ
jgi:hypothetical protein